MSAAIPTYDRQAAELAELYESLPFERAHAASLDLIPDRPGLMLDVGAGSGRDAAWFTGRGWEVVAVEPAYGMRPGAATPMRGSAGLATASPGSRRCTGWAAGSTSSGSAPSGCTWGPGERVRAFRKLVALLKPGGRLIISLRHGPSPPGRRIYETRASELERLALDFA